MLLLLLWYVTVEFRLCSTGKWSQRGMMKETNSIKAELGEIKTTFLLCYIYSGKNFFI